MSSDSGSSDASSPDSSDADSSAVDQQLLEGILDSVLHSADIEQIESTSTAAEDVKPTRASPTKGKGKAKSRARRSIVKSELSVVKRSMKLKRIYDKSITSFIEGPPRTPGGPPTMLLVSPVQPEKFLEYFTGVLWPFALQALRHATELQARGIESEVQRVDRERESSGAPDTSIPVTMVYPTIEQYVFPADKSKPHLSTPLHPTTRNC